MKKRAMTALLLIAVLVLLIGVPQNASAAFAIRTTMPTESDPGWKYYSAISTYPRNTHGGNCTWYAFGRAYEVLGTMPALNFPGYGNAQNWYQNVINQGIYQVGSTPRPASIACWNSGTYGHVAFVEAVNANGTITMTDSSWDTSYPAFAIHYNVNPSAYMSGFQGYIYLPYDREPPKASSAVNVRSITKDGFFLTFDATDNMGIAEVYARVRAYGQSEAKTFTGSASGGSAIIQVSTSSFDGFQGPYYVVCGVKDAAGNWTEVNIKHQKIELYPVTVAVGTYKTTEATFGHDAPCEEINGERTASVYYPKGTMLTVTGSYTNKWDATYLQTADGSWVYAGHLQYHFHWSDVFDYFKSIAYRFIYYFAGQYVEADVSSSGTRGASTSGGSIAIMGLVLSGGIDESPSDVSCYTVSFDGNGGDPSFTEKSVAAGRSFGHLPIAYRLGYSFDGWYTASEGGNPISESDICSGSLTLYAHWTRIVLLDNVQCGDSLYVTLYGDGEMLVTGSGEMTSHPWTAEDLRERVVSVSLPEELTGFCSYAFYGCTYLNRINIPRVDSIPANCFNGCQYLRGLDLPETVTAIEDYAFAGSDLHELTLPSGLTYLGHHILDGNTGVTSVTIPATLTTVSYGTRDWTYEARSGGNNPYEQYGPFTGSAVETAVIESGMEYIPICLFANADCLKSVTIPDTVTALGQPDNTYLSLAFYGTDALESIELPDSITTIRAGAFAYSGLSSLTLPKHLTTLGCQVLFRNTGVKSILLPNTINELTEPQRWDSPGPFYGSGIEKAELEAGSTTVFAECFNGASKLTTVLLPDSLTTIEHSAFYECEALTSVSIPVNVTGIGDYAFAYCKALTALPLPDSLTVIGSCAFANSGLLELELPPYLLELGCKILDGNTGVKSITVPSMLTTVSYGTRYWEFSARSGGNDPYEQYGPFTGSAIETAVIESGMEYVPICLFANADKLRSVTIPDTVTTLGPSGEAYPSLAFYGTDALESIQLPDSVTAIYAGAFAYSGLTSLTLPKQLTTLGCEILFGNTGVKSILLPNTVNELTEPLRWSSPGPFYGSGIETAELEAGSPMLYAECFNGASKLTTVLLPDSVTAIERYAFYECEALTTVNIPANVTAIGDSAFAYCKALTALKLPDSLTVVGSYAFAYSGLLELTLPPCLLELGCKILDGNTGVKSITVPSMLTTVSYGTRYWEFSARSGGNDPYEQYGPFTGSAIETAVLESGMEHIPVCLFANADCLKSVTIPDTVSSLGPSADAYLSLAFYGTDALDTVVLPDSVTAVYAGAFAFSGLERLEGGAGLKVIGDSVFFSSGLQEYLVEAELESLGENVFKACDSLRVVHVGSVPAYTFSGCASLEEVKLVDSAASIGDSAFSGCTSLRSIIIGEQVEDLGSYAFSECDSLTEVTIPDAVHELRAGLFSGCDSLVTVHMPDTVTAIGEKAFYGCRVLADCDLPQALESIGSYAFADCDALTKAVMHDRVSSLGAYAYYDCDALEAVTLSPALRAIPDYAFTHCDSLASIVVPNRVTRIGSYAFHDDVSLVAATLPRALTEIGTEAFNYQDRLVVTGVAGTYAETWAKANRFTFIGLNAPATAVSLDHETLTLEEGQLGVLTMTVTPADCTDAVSWKSSDESVAAVTEDGEVRALSVGTATIRVSVGENGVGANCEVTVVPPNGGVYLSVWLNSRSLTLDALDVYSLNAYVDSNAEVEGVTWSSSDDTVAAVDAEGNVTALAEGTATITAAARTLGGVAAKAECTVTVNHTAHFAATAADLASPHSYPDNCGDYWVYTGAGAEKLTVTFSPETNVEQGFDYLCLYDGKMNLLGTYTGTALAGQTVEFPGDTAIVRLVSGSSGSAYGFAVTSITPYVFVPVPARGLSLEQTAITMQSGTRTTLYPVFDPIDTTNQEVRWSSSNTEIVTVSQDGVVTALKEGSATVTATSADGGYTASLRVRVGSTVSLGDVNNDGDCDAGDAMMILRHAVQLIDLTEAERAAADVNGDGRVDVGDAVLILRYDAGLIPKLPAEN